MKTNATRSDRKIVGLECPIKEKEDRIALNNGPTISPTRKGGQKKQNSKVLQFLIMVNRVLMYQTSMCALVLLFWIPYQSKGGPNCVKGSYKFSHKKRRSKEAKPKGPAVSYQGNQGLNMPNKHVCFSAAFLNSLSK